jgi:hypothetical protein
LRAELALQIAKSEQDLDRERRNVGLYVISYVRAIMPPTEWSLYARLGQALTRTKNPRSNIWNVAGIRMAPSEWPLGVNLYSRVQAELDARARAAILTVDHVDELPGAIQKCMHYVMKEETGA